MVEGLGMNKVYIFMFSFWMAASVIFTIQSMINARPFDATVCLALGIFGILSGLMEVIK